MGILIETRDKGFHFEQGIEPSNPTDGMTWKDTVNKIYKVYKDSAWIEIDTYREVTE